MVVRPSRPHRMQAGRLHHNLGTRGGSDAGSIPKPQVPSLKPRFFCVWRCAPDTKKPGRETRRDQG